MISQTVRHLRLEKTIGRQILGTVTPHHQTAVMVGTFQSTNILLSQYSTSRKLENSLIIGGLTVAASAATLKYALAAYEKYEATKPPPSENTAAATDGPGDSASADSAKAEAATAKAKEEEQAKPDTKKRKGDTAGQQAAKKADSIFASWFARNFYDGGFEDKMTKREAALVLGIRESATVEKVKEAHRRVLLLNHPDRGGSAFLAAKINEAKDLLLKGRV